jgi:hypothetical protein
LDRYGAGHFVLVFFLFDTQVCLGITHQTKKIGVGPFAWSSLWSQGLPYTKIIYLHPPQPYTKMTIFIHHNMLKPSSPLAKELAKPLVEAKTFKASI